MIKLHEAGLLYKAEAPVNWCPSCKTVLANEQVISGKCERCESDVETKNLRQWFIKITDYADRLLDNLEKIDWSQRTKVAQKNWIGRSDGYNVVFPVVGENIEIEIFTTRADTLFGTTYMVLAPEHKIVEQLKEKIENWDEVVEYVEIAGKKTQEERILKGTSKTGIELKGVKAINPTNKEEISIWVADYVLADYGTGAIMAVPAHDERDFEFAKKFGLPIKQVICPNYPETTCPVLEDAYVGEGHLVWSGKFDGTTTQDARKLVGEYAKGKAGKHYHLRDWLISRQRYWGPPIPFIYCAKCRESQGDKSHEGVDWTVLDEQEVAIIPVPEKDLPVELPITEDFRPTGTDKSPLATVEEFVNVKCPDCGADATRETDVSDTFLDSSWYFLRYPSTDSDDSIFEDKRNRKWLPVDMYIGGQEHAVLHLLYARFMTMFLHDQKFIDFEEPFEKFRAHGLIIKDGKKMSKSRGNVINPDEYLTSWGADTIRMFMMFLSPIADGADWRDDGIKGVHRFLGRVWGLVQKYSKEEKGGSVEVERNKTIKKVTEDIESLHYNTAIAAMMAYLNVLYDNEHTLEDIKALLLLLAPFAPHITEELWERLELEGSVHDQEWPEFDEKLIQEDVITMPVQINGKVRGQIEIAANALEEDIKKTVLADEKIRKILEEKEPKKIIVVKGKIVNLVI